MMWIGCFRIRGIYYLIGDEKIGVHFAHLEFVIETETHATSENIKVKNKKN